jgi:hypothetical protein
MNTKQTPSGVPMIGIFTAQFPGIESLAGGAKGLLDVLKVRVTGRRDGLYLYYFGAIVDDDSASVDVSWEQELVAHPKVV